MKDRLKRELAVGDIVEQVAVLKDQTKGYISSAYQCELNYFRKVEVVS